VVASGWFAVFNSAFNLFVVRAILDGMATKSTTSKNPAAVALGRLGGLKGGPARTASMTPAQRKAAARKAALARWSKKNKKA